MLTARIPATDFIVAPGFRGSFDDYVNRGRSYLVLGRHERALAILDKAVKHDPTSYPALVARAEALSHRGRYLEAVRALALHARLVLTSLLTSQKEVAAAAEEYKRAVELFRDNPETLHRIAAHMSDGGHEEGQSSYSTGSLRCRRNPGRP